MVCLLYPGLEEIYVKGTSFWISKYSYYDYGDDVKVIGTHEAQMDYGESDEKSVTVTEMPRWLCEA